MGHWDEVRDFLASRRARLTPPDVGLPTTGRRRVPGLRRPDVGVLALDYDVMQVVQEPGLMLVAYSAAPGSADADGLALLASLAATRDAAADAGATPNRA
ncbi:MmyB family transcriptional regulator [Cellulomonas timonensis]|uniref:MmyB family transcriptional regulator n=1 Tax=Cellulomonas timonensis TaxID=1689271 RepID=UPI0009ED0548|nr:hypothetical protein [Cellulomonas timonensis]